MSKSATLQQSSSQILKGDLLKLYLWSRTILLPQNVKKSKESMFYRPAYSVAQLSLTDCPKEAQAIQMGHSTIPQFGFN